MIDTPQIVQSDHLITAVIRVTIPREQIQSVMGPAIGEVMGVVIQQGAGPAGPVYSYHFSINPETFDFEVGVPVTKPITPTGRVQPSELPAATVAHTIYHGPYEGLGSAWGEFCNWISTHGHKTSHGLWECYIKGPESSPDSASWQTELNQPLVDDA